MYLSFGILHIPVTIHEGSTPPLPNRGSRLKIILTASFYCFPVKALKCQKWELSEISVLASDTNEYIDHATSHKVETIRRFSTRQEGHTKS